MTAAGVIRVLVVDDHTLFRRGLIALLAELNFDVTAAEARLAALEEAGRTAVLVGVDGKVAGLVAVADTVKPHAREAIDALRRLGGTL